MIKAKFHKLEIIYICLLATLIILSYFILIPTDSTNAGLSSEELALGDRLFYISEDGKGFGYNIDKENYKGNFLYPYILKAITSVSNIFGQDQYSVTWNSFAIFLTSIISLFSLRLLRLSSLFLFNERVSLVASLIFVINPYTYYYSITGGITNYLILGVTFVFYLFSSYCPKIRKIEYSDNLKYLFFICTGCVYLSCLRPTGSFFSFSILFIFLYKYLKEISKNENQRKNFISILILLISFFLVGLNFNQTLSYSFLNIHLFQIEDGNFFGFPRNAIRENIELMQFGILNNLKADFYFFLWKISDFVSGLSDIRDTHSAFLITPFAPFLFRVITGLFFLYPLNLLCALGIVSNRNLILKSDLWIVLFATFIALSPSIVGISNSRYLMMFYSPFLIFGAKFLCDIFPIIRKTL